MDTVKTIQLSKGLSWLLRHGAIKEGLPITKNGFVNVSDILNHQNFIGRYSVDDVKRVVHTNNKQRFSLRYNENNELQICANQGHSLQEINVDLFPVLIHEKINIIHGTFLVYWKIIKKEGISRMKRNHIHFGIDLPDNKSEINGARKNAEVFIYINLSLSISDGLKFYRSANNVVLSPGDKHGFIKPKYFLKICNIKGQTLA